MFHSQTRSRPLSGTLLNFGHSQAAKFIVAPLCLAPRLGRTVHHSRIPVPSGPAEVRPGHSQLLLASQSWREEVKTSSPLFPALGGKKVEMWSLQTV